MITGLLPYPSENHRKQRKWTHSAFGDKKSAQKHDVMQRRETCILLLSLMDTPGDYVMHIKRYVLPSHDVSLGSSVPDSLQRSSSSPCMVIT